MAVLGRRAPASWNLLPMCQEALLDLVLLLANQQLTPNIISWEELEANEGCWEELPACAVMLSPTWRQRKGRVLPLLLGVHGVLASSAPPTVPQDTWTNLSPSKTPTTEAGAVPAVSRARKEALLAFDFTMEENSSATSILLGSPGPTV